MSRIGKIAIGIGKKSLGGGGAAILDLAKAIELQNARMLNQTQYGWLMDFMDSIGAPQSLVSAVTQEKRTFLDGTPMPAGLDQDYRLAGAIAIGLRDGDFMHGSLMDNPEYGVEPDGGFVDEEDKDLPYENSHRLASEVAALYTRAGYDPLYSITKAVEAFNRARLLA